MALDFETTKDVIIPKDPFERIIGQPEAVEIAKMVPYQRRHLLLVGPPGTGKSMIAQAISSKCSRNLNTRYRSWRILITPSAQS